MTYSNNSSANPFSSTFCPILNNIDDIQMGRPVELWALIFHGVMWMFKVSARAQNEGQVRRIQRSQAYRLVMMALAMILTILPGSRADKKARLRAILKKANTRMDMLHKRYTKWRQRKCWMWAGGFMNAMLAELMTGPKSSKDNISFDTLIPD